MTTRTRVGTVLASLVGLALLGLVPTGAQARPLSDPTPAPDRQHQLTVTATGLDRLLGADALDPYLASGKVVVPVSNPRAAARVLAGGGVPKLTRFTAAQLGAVKTRLDGLAKTLGAGQVKSWSVDPVTGTVVVKVVRGAADSVTNRFLARARESGAMLTVRTSYGRVRPTADLLGGYPVDMTNGFACSLGFNARTRTGARIFLTAGHCTSGMPTFKRYGSTIGKARTSSFPGNDYGTVNISYAYWTQRGLVERWGAADVPVRGYSSAPVGALVCKSGRTTRWTCGRIVAKNVTVNYGGDIVSGLFEHTACVEGGDSGGANLSGNYAQGVTSGAALVGNLCLGKYGQPNESYSQPIGEVLSASSASLVLG